MIMSILQLDLKAETQRGRDGKDYSTFEKLKQKASMAEPQRARWENGMI